MAEGSQEESMPPMEKMYQDKPFNQYLTLYFEDLFGAFITFRIRKKRRMRAVMIAYHVRRNFPIGSFYFLYSGHLLCGNETPASLDMKDGDIIKVIPTLTAD